jgi:hypothetical protein
MANLFSSGFETGDLTEWSSAVTDSGKLSVSAGAKLHGSYGMQIDVSSTAAKYVVDATPNSERRYRCRFYFNRGTASIQDYEQVTILKAMSSANLTYYVQYRYQSGVYSIQLNVMNDAQAPTGTSFYTITDAVHYIEIDCLISSTAGANDGTATLYIDGSSKQTLTGIDNDQNVVTDVRWGCTGGDNSPETGTIYFDDFASNNDGTAIGAYVATAALTGTATASITEADIVTGGKTIILTLTGDTWVTAGATFNAQRQNIINGLTSAQSETHGWNNEVKAKIAVTDVVQTSTTIVTITLDAEAAYDITSTETITATIPATALTGGVAIVASPTFAITATAGATLPVGGKTLLGVGA